MPLHTTSNISQPMATREIYASDVACRLERVKSINTSGHKYGLSPLGVPRP